MLGGCALGPAGMTCRGCTGEPPGRSPLASLTRRERQVLALMAEGRSNQATGERLSMTTRTVESHMRSIFSKLGLRRGRPTSAASWRSSATCAPGNRTRG
jgi:DNA-binding CsgD family transcriptional regulator